MPLSVLQKTDQKILNYKKWETVASHLLMSFTQTNFHLPTTSIQIQTDLQFVKPPVKLRQVQISHGPSQVSSTTSAIENDQIRSHKIAYEAGNNLRVFTYAQLKNATQNFRRDMVVGRGGFGKVYKGGLKEKLPSHGIKRLKPSKAPHKLIFAVKQLDASSKQGFREWLAEVNILGRLSHPNLVKLLGYSTEEGKFFLV